jgi:hypothetical protein
MIMLKHLIVAAALLAAGPASASEVLNAPKPETPTVTAPAWPQHPPVQPKIVLPYTPVPHGPRFPAPHH